jgi:hypothetical protein
MRGDWHINQTLSLAERADQFAGVTFSGDVHAAEFLLQALNDSAGHLSLQTLVAQ